MQVLEVKTQTSNYPIYVGQNILSKLKPAVENASQIIVITDETVYHLHYAQLKNYLPDSTLVYQIKPGEFSKSFQTYYDIQTFLIHHQVDRSALLLAFGGGVVGDLAGFVASTYMRGIDFIQIPTTLLAHDSAIGGKVAINHEQGKNLIGAFYPPIAVFYELPFLLTLSSKEWRSGFGEMLKHGLIQDANLLERLMQQSISSEMLTSNVASLLVKSLEVKQRIVQEDEFEKGQRAFLNFGHTFAHAIELVHKELAHGEAVALGMVFALYVSQRELNLDYDSTVLLDYLMQANYPFPIEVACLDTYMTYMMHDKKNINQDIGLVLLKSVEKPVLKRLSKKLTTQYVLEFLIFIMEWRESRCV